MSNLYSALIGFLFLICYAQWRFFWRPYILEKFRDDLFKAREMLFDYAREGKIDFSDKAYLILRKRINSLLRYGHRINFTNLFVAWIFPLPNFEKFSKKHKQEFIDSIEALPSKESQDLIYEVKNVVSERVGKYLLNSAPILILLFPIFLVIQFYRDFKALMRLFLIADNVEVFKKYLAPHAILQQIEKDLLKVKANKAREINWKVGVQMEQEIFLEEKQKEYSRLGQMQIA
jgi:hypothetical protein